jgi:hypothetical protein
MGFWTLDDRFLSLFINKLVPELGEDETKEVKATALAIAVFRRVLSCYVDDWEMLVLKAERWLVKNARDHQGILRRAEALF